MDHMRKIKKVTKESVIEDITSSIRDISSNVESIGEKYKKLLVANRAVVLYLQDIKKSKEHIDLEETQTDSEDTAIEKEL